MKQRRKKALALAGSAVSALMVGTSLYGLYMAGLGFWGPLKGLCIRRITKQYKAEERNGEIIFYGASNFARWMTLEENIPQYKVQNHAFGGSDDQNLMDYADRLLYPYHPRIIVFQTGSNDYVAARGSDEEKIAFCMKRKEKMFQLFHERMPDAQFIIMSGLLLYGRKEYLELTREINRRLEAFCGQRDYMTFVNADALTLTDGQPDAGRFVDDGIHLTPAAQIIWADEYIILAIDKVVNRMGTDADDLRK